MHNCPTSALPERAPNANSSTQRTVTETHTQVGTSVSAGSVNVTARNPKPNPDGTTAPATANADRILIEGRQVMTTEDINLNADRDITLLAAGNTSEHSSQNKSSSGRIGVGFNIDGHNTGLSVNASASRAKGRADGTSQSSTNTRVQAGDTLTSNSGGDTTMKGATANGNKVTGTVSGNLNLAQTQINSDFKSVGEQSAIRAGDGGFDVSVKGKTDLIGGQITSTQAAIDHHKNSFSSAGGVTTTDLQSRVVCKVRWAQARPARQRQRWMICKASRLPLRKQQGLSAAPALSKRCANLHTVLHSCCQSSVEKVSKI